MPTWLFESEGVCAEPFLWDLMDARDELGNDPQRSMPEAAREPRTPTGLSRYALRCTTMFAHVRAGERAPGGSRDLSGYVCFHDELQRRGRRGDRGCRREVRWARTVGRIVRVAGC